jgi:hypothetical protein
MLLEMLAEVTAEYEVRRTGWSLKWIITFVYFVFYL